MFRFLSESATFIAIVFGVSFVSVIAALTFTHMGYPTDRFDVMAVMALTMCIQGRLSK